MGAYIARRAVQSLITLILLVVGLFFALQVLGNQHADRLPDRLRFLVTEHPLGGRVPRRDDAVEVLGDDGVVGGLD